MRHAAPVLLGALVLLAYGVAQGVWTDRWHTSRALQEAQAKLDQVPLRVGPWEGRAEELDPREVRQADLRAYVLRRYVHPERGDAVTVLLVCGRPGPVAVHTPEVCFGGAGFGVQTPPARQAVEPPGGEPAEFWAAHFARPRPVLPDVLQVYWSWNSGGAWEAADDPRVHFAPARVLYKLYVVRQQARPNERPADNPVPDFLRQLVPAIDRCLFPAPEPGA
jgi:hypothetical protein